MKSYPEEVKLQVIERYMSGEPTANILAETGTAKRTSYSWVRIYQEKQKDTKQRAVSLSQ